MRKPHAPKLPWRWRVVRWAVGLTAFMIGVGTLPHRWCAREARGWFTGEPTLQQRLARGVEHWLDTDLSRASFTTGSAQFNGEWLFGTYLMAGLGYGQTALEHPAWRARNVVLMERCIEHILTPQVRGFDRESWKDDPIDTLDGDSDHAAYLGYLNLLLGLHRALEPDSKYVALNDRITAALARRLRASRTLLLQTYPHQVYPADNCAVIASIGLHDRVTAGTNGPLVAAWLARCRANYLDPRTGLLIQAVDPDSGRPIDAGRGSGTALGLYFLSFIDRPFAAELFKSLKTELGDTRLGFAAVREYPRGTKGGYGDIDSGPVVLGYGVSPTGFALAGCRVFGDAGTFTGLYSLAHLVGAPRDQDGARHYVTGGPLGDAILFAMLTAQPELRLETKPAP